MIKQFCEVKHLWGMPPKNSGGSTKFPGGHKVIDRTAQTAFVRVVTPRRIRTVKIKSVTIGSSRFFQIMDWISVLILYSHLTYYELRMIHDRKSSRSVSCFARAECSFKTERFTVFENKKSKKNSFVLRIIKRNYC